MSKQFWTLWPVLIALLCGYIRAADVKFDEIDVKVAPGDVLEKSWQTAPGDNPMPLFFVATPKKCHFVKGSGSVTGSLDKWIIKDNDEYLFLAYRFSANKLDGGKQYNAAFSGKFDCGGTGPGETPTWTVKTTLQTVKVVIDDEPEPCLCQGNKFTMTGHMEPTSISFHPLWSIDNTDKLQINSTTGEISFKSTAAYFKGYNDFDANVTLTDDASKGGTGASATKVIHICGFKRPGSAYFLPKGNPLTLTPTTSVKADSLRGDPDESDSDSKSGDFGVGYQSDADHCPGRATAQFKIQAVASGSMSIARTIPDVVKGNNAQVGLAVKARVGTSAPFYSENQAIAFSIGTIQVSLRVFGPISIKIPISTGTLSGEKTFSPNPGEAQHNGQQKTHGAAEEFKESVNAVIEVGVSCHAEGSAASKGKIDGTLDYAPAKDQPVPLIQFLPKIPD